MRVLDLIFVFDFFFCVTIVFSFMFFCVLFMAILCSLFRRFYVFRQALLPICNPHPSI